MLYGSDLSEFQAVASVPLARDRFWYVRCADGLQHPDATWKMHTTMAVKHKIDVGSYLFARPKQDPVGQAHFLAAHSPLSSFLPPAIDVEDFPVGPDAMALFIDRMLITLTNLTHHAIVIYISAGNIDRVNWSRVTHLPMVYWWEADWAARRMTFHQFGRPVMFWQNRNRGGSGGGDTDIFLGSEAELLAFLSRPKPPHPQRPATLAQMVNWVRSVWIPEHYKTAEYRAQEWNRITVADAVRIWHAHGGI